MSDGFSNPIIGGGGALAYPSIHSPNFDVANPAASPTPSWGILKSGLAYFFGLILAGGTITGPDYIINTSGVFIYSGAPAAGNLIGSWTFGPAGGADGFGNAYPAGLTIGSNTTTQVNLSSAAGAGFLQFLTNNAGFTAAALRAAGGSFEQLLLGGPARTLAGHVDQVLAQLNSSDGAGSANGVLQYTDITGGAHFHAHWDSAGFTIAAGKATGVVPGTGSVATPAGVETWHPVSLAAGWSTLAGQPVPSYRVWAQDNTVELVGALQFTGNIPVGQALSGVNLGAGYQPATTQFIAGGPGAAGVQVNTNGSVLAVPSPGQTTVFCNFNGKYPVNL